MNNKERERDEEVEIDLKELFFILLHHLWIIVLAGIVLAAGMFVYTRSFVTPLYSSTASVYVLNRQSSDQLTYSDLNSSMQLTKDYQQMFVSRTVLEQGDRESAPAEHGRQCNVALHAGEQDFHQQSERYPYYQPYGDRCQPCLGKRYRG